jgi:hypothetical protein
MSEIAFTLRTPVNERYRDLSTIRGDGDAQKHFLTVISEPTEKAKKNTLSHAPW